jgi:hypothetical protein
MRREPIAREAFNDRQSGCVARLIVAAALTIGFGVSGAEACVCVATHSGNPACQARWEYTQVFVGRVTSVVPERPDKSGYLHGAQTTQFAVTESFVGVQSRTLQVIDSGSDRSYRFEVGKEYLVYATREGVAVCSPTRTIEDAAEDLRYLRGIPALAPGEGRIVGMALRHDSSQATPYQRPTPCRRHSGPLPIDRAHTDHAA